MIWDLAYQYQIGSSSGILYCFRAATVRWFGNNVPIKRGFPMMPERKWPFIINSFLSISQQFLHTNIPIALSFKQAGKMCYCDLITNSQCSDKNLKLVKVEESLFQITLQAAKRCNILHRMSLEVSNIFCNDVSSL